MSSRQIVVHPDGRIVRSDSGDFDLQDDSSPRLGDLKLSVSLLAPSELSKLQALASAPISTSDDGEISLRIDGRAQVARIDASTDDSVTRTILRIFGMTTSDGQRIAESGASAILPIVQIVWREASGEWDALLVYPDARVEYQLLSSEKIDLEGVGIAKLLELAPEEFAPLQNALEQWNAAQSNYLAANWSLRKNEPGMLVISSRQGPTFKVRRKGQLPAELKRVLSLAQQLRVRFSMKGN